MHQLGLFKISRVRHLPCSESQREKCGGGVCGGASPASWIDVARPRDRVLGTFGKRARRTVLGVPGASVAVVIGISHHPMGVTRMRVTQDS